MLGEYVAIEFSSTDASTAAAVTLKDADGKTRTLQSFERLLIGQLTGVVAESATDPSTNVEALLFDDADGDGVVDPGELIVAFTGNTGRFDGGHEGYSCGVGRTPKVLTSDAVDVAITGVGSIVNGTTEGHRPSWREALPGRVG